MAPRYPLNQLTLVAEPDDEVIATEAPANLPPLEEIIHEGRMWISPELAKRIIAERVYARQRPLKAGHVLVQADMLKRGKFVSNHQIWFATTSGILHLVDGQHRLNAIIKSGIGAYFTVQLLPLKSADELHEAYNSFDRVIRQRTTPEMLAATGVAEAHNVIRLTALALFRAAFLIHFKFNPPHSDIDPVAVRSDSLRLSYAEPYWELAAEYEQLTQAAPGPDRRRLRSPQVMAVALLTLEHQHDKAVEFWGGIADNDGLRRGDPRNTLLVWLREKLFSRRGYPGAIAAALAWNAFYEGRKLESLRIGATSGVYIFGTPLKK